MTYKINGTAITLQPETGQWVTQEPIGTDGNGRAIYPAPREFEMKWGLMSMSEFAQIKTFFSSVGATGTVSVDLPEYGASSWQFRTYSGCVLSQPEMSAFFEEYINDVRLIVRKVNIV